MRGGFVPGDVAVVMRNGKEVVAMRYDTGVERGWRWQRAEGFAFDHFDADPGTTPRPLIVIDPDDRAQVERLARLLWPHYSKSESARLAKADITQAALRSLVAPPKPAEPQGLGAVVEDEDERTWVLVNRDADMWRLCEGPARGKFSAYADITAVRVLSEGVRNE